MFSDSRQTQRAQFKLLQIYKLGYAANMNNSQRPHEPMFNFTEKAPAYLVGVFIAIEALFSLLPALQFGFVQKFGVLKPLGAKNMDGLSHAVSLIGHGFLHGGWGHVIMNSGMIIVFGIAVIRGARLLSTSKGKPPAPSREFFIVFFAGVIIGGLFQWGWWASTNAHLISTGAVGASGGASALFAAGAWAIGGRHKMLQFGIGWTAINLIMAYLGKFPEMGLNIAWPAHIGGYVAGVILAPWLVKANSTRLSAV